PRHRRRAQGVGGNMSARIRGWSFFVTSTVIAASALAYGCAASGSDASSDEDGGVANESGANDSSSHDGASGFDAGSFDGGPGDVSTFQPAWHPPIGMHLGACTSSQIDNYYAACLGPLADVFTCQSFTTSNAACAQCISTNDTAASYGPLINDTNIGIVEVN